MNIFLLWSKGTHAYKSFDDKFKEILFVLCLLEWGTRNQFMSKKGLMLSVLLMPQFNFSHFVLRQQENRWCCEDWLLYSFNLLVRCPRRSTQHQFWGGAFVSNYNDKFVTVQWIFHTNIAKVFSKALGVVFTGVQVLNDQND